VNRFWLEQKTRKYNYRTFEEEASDFAPWVLLTTAHLKFKDLGFRDHFKTLSQLLKTGAGNLKKEVNQHQLRFTQTAKNEWLELFQNRLTHLFVSRRNKLLRPIRLLNSAMTWQVFTWDFYMTNQVICFPSVLQRRRSVKWI